MFADSLHYFISPPHFYCVSNFFLFKFLYFLFLKIYPLHNHHHHHHHQYFHHRRMGVNDIDIFYMHFSMKFYCNFEHFKEFLLKLTFIHIWLFNSLFVYFYHQSLITTAAAVWCDGVLKKWQLAQRDEEISIISLWPSILFLLDYPTTFLTWFLEGLISHFRFLI